MKRILSLALALALFAGLFAFTAIAEESIDPALLAAAGVTLKDGVPYFNETKKITVEVFDRGLDNGKTPAYDNVWTNWIKETLLAKHNIEVEYQPVDRWTESDQINNLLAAGDAPGVCVTYNYAAVQQYANMGGVVELESYLEKYADLLPNLFIWPGERNLKWNLDPKTNELWALVGKVAAIERINTFVRKDWLEKLGLDAPTDIDEFEAMLVAFKDNAQLLLGDDADKMVPFSISYDVGWRADHLTAAFYPESLTDKDVFINGFDDRRLQYPGYKEGIRKLNDWYNKGLIWSDFALYGSGDTTEDNMMKAGFVGAFIHNWDYPYRDGDNGITGNLHALVGPDADYVAVSSFKNEAGVYRKFLPADNDRNIFLPINDEDPLARLIYVDFISSVDTQTFLQIGEEGKSHLLLDDGTIQIISGTAAADPAWIQNSLYNIDYTTTINGLNINGDPELSSRAKAFGYAGTSPDLIVIAKEATRLDGRIGKKYDVGEIKSQEGMDTPLKEKRDIMLCNAIIASPENFDKVFDDAYADYLASGAQAIRDERAEAWQNTYGDAEWID